MCSFKIKNDFIYQQKLISEVHEYELLFLEANETAMEYEEMNKWIP